MAAHHEGFPKEVLKMGTWRLRKYLSKFSIRTISKAFVKKTVGFIQLLIKLEIGADLDFTMTFVLFAISCKCLVHILCINKFRI